MSTATSEKLAPFVARWEGFVSRAYVCPAGVLTIGYGFTMRSKTFAEYWRGKHGRALRKGDTIGKDEAMVVLIKLLAAEYSAPVARALPATIPQHCFDGATSVSFNCGPGSLKWQWAKALAAFNASKSAALLRTTAITANGKKLAGLVRRRREEAAMIEHGAYSGAGADASRSTAIDDVKQYQGWLKSLGYYTREVDGIAGPSTTAAVRAFQDAEDLVIDGEVGPATRAALLRALDRKAAKTAAAGAAPAGAATGVAVDTVQQAPGSDLPASQEMPISVDPSLVYWGIGAALVALAIVALVFFVRSSRGKFTGKRVPT